MKQTYDAKTAASITALAQRIMESNLCKEIIMPMPKTIASLMRLPQPKYQFSRSKWYEAKLHKNIDDALDWCEQQFGKEPNHPDAWSRWYFNVNKTFRFRDEKDYNWFILRWGA